MTEHKHPDDGGSAYPFVVQDLSKYQVTEPGMSLRAKFAETFAAAWLPLILPETKGGRFEAAGEHSNELGLAMADDLIRRLRESK